MMNFDVIEELKALSKNVSVKIVRLTKIRSRKKLRIKDTRQKNSIYIVDELKSIPLNSVVSMEVCRHFPCPKKYSGLVASNIGELIKFSGGTKEAIQRIENSLRSWVFPEPSIQTKAYAEKLYDVMINLSGIIDRYPQKQYKAPQAFCILCWREVDHALCNNENLESRRKKGSVYYCKKHRLNKKLCQRDKRNILSAMKNIQRLEFDNYERLKQLQSDDYGLNSRISGWLRFFSVSPNTIRRTGFHKSIEITFNENWIKYANQILGFVKEIYPITYENIEKIRPDESLNWLSYFNKLRTALDPDGHTIGNEWLRAENNYLDYQLLLTVLMRHESYWVIEREANSSKSKNNREQILYLHRKQLSTLDKPSFSKIAKEVGVSKQYVSELINKDKKQ